MSSHGEFPSLRGKRVAAVGVAKSGTAALRLLLRQGAVVTGVDQRPLSELSATVSAPAFSHVRWALGPSPEDLLARMDLVVVSPGVPLSSPMIQAARKHGVAIWGESELAWRFLRPAPLVGITGTNGKSTTTALCGQMFRSAGRAVFVGGNLGLPLSEAALSTERFDAYVVELSSFQLEGIVSFRPDAAAVLNLTRDHVDRYASQAEYAAAKARIFRNQIKGDWAVVNADAPAVVAMAKGAASSVLGFTCGSDEKSDRFYGLAHPEEQGFAINWPGGSARFRLVNRALRGAHNLQNAMAAALLAKVEGLSDEAIQKGLDDYPGLPHRLEWVANQGGVEWINDSKATNVDSTLVALRALPAGVWLIAGGRGKGAPYLPLVDAAAGRLKGILTIGEDAAKIADAFSAGFPVYSCETLPRAVERAAQLARPGEIVLLSPACASYDQFTNFEHRGEAFKKLVRGLW